jgi:formylglycine-generating enzyme required for sulfatase activity
MSDFYRKFLSEDARKMGAPSGRHVFLAAFGKHPGWDDHIEDLGLESESLVYAKSLLYVKGIGGQIDSGGWEKLDDAQRLPVFKHLFVWQRGPQTIIGRMWASSDGKGRTRYPMIVCAQCIGVPAEWALAQVLPRLEQIEQACCLTNSAAEVRSTLDRHRSELRAGFAANPQATAWPVTSAVLADFVNHSTLGPEKEGWFRILHQMGSQMALFAPGRFSLKGDLSGLRAQQIRVPAGGASPATAFLLWAKFFQTQIDPTVPLLYTLPLEESWMDVTAGEPSVHELFSLRASPRAVPLASEVPYNLEPAFREKARAQIAAFAGETAMNARPSATAVDPTQPPPPATGSKLLRWLGGGATVIALAALAVALTFGNRGKSRQLAAAPTPPPPPAPVTNPISIADTRRVEAETRLQAAADADASALASAAAAEKRRQAEAEAKLRADAEAKLRAEAEARAKAELDAKAKLEAEARANAEPPRPVAPVLVASVAPASVPEPKPVAAAPARHITNHIGVELILLPGDLWVGKYEITQGEYVKVMNTNPSRHTGNPRLPVDSVTWDDARAFCDKLTELEKAAGALPAGFAYDLPTQAQWDAFLGDATFEHAVTSQKESRKFPSPAGAFRANVHGLHDVLGNVWEWCLDGPNSQTRAARGGAFNNLPTFNFTKLLPSTVRKLPPTEKSPDLGFRCVLAKGR